jgi:phosphate transport system substrate-binding protein
MISSFRNYLLAVFCFLTAGPVYGQTDTIFVDGSNGVRPLVVEVAEAFEQNFPNIVVIVGEGMGTSQRIEALKNGTIDVAMASHGIDIPYFTRQGLQVHWFAKMAIVIGVHKSVPLKKISTSALCAIYRRDIQDWRELGSVDLPIVPLARPMDEVDMEVLAEKVGCLPDPGEIEGLTLHQKSGPLARALAQTPGAIGMTAAVRQVQAKGTIKALKIDGVYPSLRKVRKDQYPFQRNAYLITEGLDDPVVKRFVQFFKTKTAKKVLARNAAVPAQ